VQLKTSWAEIVTVACARTGEAILNERPNIGPVGFRTNRWNGLRAHRIDNNRCQLWRFKLRAAGTRNSVRHRIDGFNRAIFIAYCGWLRDLVDNSGDDAFVGLPFTLNLLSSNRHREHAKLATHATRMELDFIGFLLSVAFSVTRPADAGSQRQTAPGLNHTS